MEIKEEVTTERTTTNPSTKQPQTMSKSTPHIRPVKRAIPWTVPAHQSIGNGVASIPDDEKRVGVESTGKVVKKWIGGSSPPNTSHSSHSSSAPAVVTSTSTTEQATLGKDQVEGLSPDMSRLSLHESHIESKGDVQNNKLGKPKGILRTPKYSSKDGFVGQETVPKESQHISINSSGALENIKSLPPDVMQPMVVERTKRKQKFQVSKQVSTKGARPRLPQQHQRLEAATAIEGYVPRTSMAIEADQVQETPTKLSVPSENPGRKEQERIILNSLSELLETTGTLPSQPGTDDDGTKPSALGEIAPGSVLEADLAFQCMDPDSYQQQLEVEKEENAKVFFGRQDIFEGDETEDEMAHVERLEDFNDPADQYPVRISPLTAEAHPHGEDDGLDCEDSYHEERPEDQDDHLNENETGFDVVDDDDSYHSDHDSEEEMRPPRAFLVLWKVIAEWVTPEAVSYVQHLHKVTANSVGNGLEEEPFSFHPDWQPQVDRSDIGASRCAGLMAIVHMHLSRCLDELGFKGDATSFPQPLAGMEREDIFRLVKPRLANLLRSFDFSRPTPRLDTAQSKALTCILLATVLPNERSKDPAADSKVVPISCASLGMTYDEYRYLSQSAVINFGSASS